MRIFLSIVSMVWLLLSLQGCHNLKKRETIESQQTLFANLDKRGENFLVKNISSDVGDVNLKTLQVHSDKVIVKLCTSKENLECIDRVLDVVENSLDRKSLLSSYDFLMQKQNRHKQKLEELYHRYHDNYLADSKKIKLRYLVNDKTRLYKGEKIPFEELLYIGLNELKYPKKALHNIDIQKLFPHTLRDFKSDVNRLSNTLDDSYKEEERIYKQTLKKRSTFYPLKRKSSMKVGNFSLEVQAPQSLNRRFEGTKRIIFHIVGKDMHDIYPDSFLAKNRELKVSFTKRETSFTNLTNKLISLESITLFYNGYNKTTLLGRYFSFSNLKAKATTSTPSNLLFSKRFKEAGFYPLLSKEKAKRTKVRFALEVKYKIEGKSNSQILFVSKKDILWRYITGW